MDNDLAIFCRVIILLDSPMKIRFFANTFVRHIDDESLVVCPRTGGCTVLRNAKSFIEALQWSWNEFDDVVKYVAKKFGVERKDVFEDVVTVCEELVSQGFAETSSEDVDIDNAVTITPDAKTDDDSMPLSDFYRRHENRPVELHIDLTDACTERCVHCYVPQGRHNFLQYDFVEKALREFRALQGLSVHLTGGEVMLHPEFRRICHLCRDLNLNILIFSNLTLCDMDMVAFLRECAPQFVNVSLYAMTPSVHDAITGIPGSWDKTINAVLHCERAGVHVRIATPLLKANRHEFGALMKFAQTHHMHLIPNFDVVPRCNHDCSNLNYTCSIDELHETLQANKALFDEGYGHEMRTPDSKVCSIGTSRLYLSAEGNYYPCDSMNEYVIGTVKQNALEDVWYGTRLDYLRNLRDRDFHECAGCCHRAYCKVCPAFNYNATGDLFGIPHVKCEVARVVHSVYGGDSCC